MEQRIFCLITVLVVCFCCFCVSEDETLSEKYKRCKNTFSWDTSFEGLHLYYYDNKFVYEFFDKELGENKFDIEKNVRHSMALTCICRRTYDPIFFLSTVIYHTDRSGSIVEKPSSECVNKVYADIYVYCLPGDRSSKPISDSEAYDILLFQYTQKIPNTLMTPFSNENNNDSFACFDIFGFSTKNIANQETCLLAAEKTNDNQVQVYSGPFLTSVLLNITKEESGPHCSYYQWCHTNVKDTTGKLPGKCIMSKHHSMGYYGPMFFCCFANESEKREIQAILTQKEGKNKLFCAISTENKISMQDYRQKYITEACCAKVTWEYFQHKEDIIKYYASTPPFSFDILINATSTGLCSNYRGKPENVTIQQCCNDGHFCNLKLFPIYRSKWSFHSPTKCSFKPNISLYFDESDFCEYYYDFADKNQVYLHENISVKIIQKIMPPDTKSYSPYGEYSCNYAYVQIINSDGSNCYDEIGSVRSVYRCTCEIKNCDNINNVEPDSEKEFSCQFLSSTKIKGSNVPDSVPLLQKTDKWICYVEIKKPFPEKPTVVVAGHIDFNGYNMMNKFKECLKKDVINQKFCCVNVFDIDQENSECTVEKQFKRFNNSINDKDPKNPSGNEVDNTDPEITHCYSKDIEMLDTSSESEYCPKSDGCFSTRILQTSEAASETAIEPAGCLGYAEDYTIDNLDLTSLSLGCRVKENWGRCSVVQSPSGEKRIVCCCNEPDENGFCNTKLTDVPEKIGKTISSFKEL